MKKIVYILFVVLLTGMVSCTKYDQFDGGLANGVHETTMWEYFKTDPYNWDSIMVMARYAGLQDIFEGKSEYGSDITFFGITNHSIRRYLLRQNDITGGTVTRITDLSKDDCKKYILTSILDKRIMLEDFAQGSASANPGQIIGTGGQVFTMLSGVKLWIYTFRADYEDVPNAGPLKIYLVSEDTQVERTVASSNIVTQTGIVHSLDYNFTLADFVVREDTGDDDDWWDEGNWRDGTEGGNDSDIIGDSTIKG